MSSPHLGPLDVEPGWRSIVSNGVRQLRVTRLWTVREVIHEIRGDTMAKEPMTQNQKFALLVFALVALGAVVFVMLTIQGNINSMF